MRSWDTIVLALALLTQGVVLGLLMGRWVAEQEAPQRAVIVHVGDRVSAIACDQLVEVATAWEIR